MYLPQELIEGIIDCLSDDYRMLETCSLVATAWLARSRHHLFSRISLNHRTVKRWCSTIRAGPDGIPGLVRTLKLHQARGRRWLETEFLDTISDQFSSFRRVENLTITWLDLSDFEPGSFARYFGHCGSSVRSLHFSYLSGDYSVFMAFLQLFPHLEDLLIHTPELYDDSPAPRVPRTAPPIRGSLNLLSLDSTSSPFVSHLAGLDLGFSSISIFNCDFSSGIPLNNLLEASSSTLRSLEFEYITFSEYVNVSLARCENLQDLTVGPFEEGSPPLLLLSLLSTLSSCSLTRLTIDFVAMPSPHWPEWKAVDTHFLQMAERCGLRNGPQVVLRTRLGVFDDVTDAHKFLPKYREIGPVELKLNVRDQRGS